MSGLQLKLLQLQNEIKVPKERTNQYGNFKFRNAEDILKAANPLLLKYKVMLQTRLEIVVIESRFYMHCTAILEDIEADQNCQILADGYCREPETLPKMDVCQVTGSASSYAKKYALCNLFNIDDGVDSDTTNLGEGEEQTIISNLMSSKNIKTLVDYWKSLDSSWQQKEKVMKCMHEQCDKFRKRVNEKK